MDQVKEKTQPKGKRIKVLGRLLKLVLTTSPWMLVVSIITIILASASAVIGSLFIERLIDTYVTPLLHEKSNSGFVMKHLPIWNLYQLLILTKITMGIS